MKPSAKWYAVAVSIIGAVIGMLCIYRYFLDLGAATNLVKELVQFFVLFLLAYLCRCLPIYIRPDFAIDMAFISNFAILLFKGPVVAVAITFL